MKSLSEHFKALSDDTRLKIIQLLTEHEMCVCELEDRLGMSQPAVSHHLRVLRRARLISGRRNGKWTYYSIKGETLMNNHNKFKQLALITVEERLSKGIPVSPVLKDGESYCRQTRNTPKR